MIMSLSYCPTFLVRVRRWLSAFRFDCLSCCDALPSICYPPLSPSPLSPPSLSISPVRFSLLSQTTPWSLQILLPRVQNYHYKTHQPKINPLWSSYIMSRSMLHPLLNQAYTPAIPALTGAAS